MRAKLAFLPHPLFLLLVFTLISLPLTAQSLPMIGIQPISGTPGTTVTISDLGGNRGRTCFARVGSSTAGSIGVMAGALTYVVPSNLAAGTTINFLCTAPGEAQSNSAVFTVTPPVVADIDNDGLPDTNDNCPTVAGPRENGGCPAPAPVDRDGDGLSDDVDRCPDTAGRRESGGCPVVEPPVDSDGDGLPDTADACPFQPGPAEVNGCAPSPTAPIPDIVLPRLSVDGACVVATQSTTAVNVRESDTTDSSIVNALNPTLVYPVSGRNAAGDWLRLDEPGGWVAAFVTRQGGDCSALPVIGDALPLALPSGDNTTAGDEHEIEMDIIVAQFAPSPEFDNCPELVGSLATLPNFVLLALASEAEPCAAAAGQLEDLFMNPQVQAGQWSFPDCGGMNDQIDEGKSTYVSLLNHTSGAAREYLESLRNDDSIFCLLLLDLSYGPYITPASFAEDGFVLPVALAYCKLGASQPAVEAKVLAVSVQPAHLRPLHDGCTFFGYLQLLGSIPQANVDFFNLLVDNCGIGAGDAALSAFSDAVRGALDAAAAAQQGCAGLQMLGGYPLPADLQPVLPSIVSGEGECAGNFRVLATHNASLGAEDVYRILKSVDPCTAAATYAATGSVPANVVPPPACIQGDTLTLGAAIMNQTVIGKSSQWFMKIAAIDRPQDQICEHAAQVGTGSSFAVDSTPTLGAFAANPTATLPAFVANPTATLPILSANPTPLPSVDAFLANATATLPVIVGNPTQPPTSAFIILPVLTDSPPEAVAAGGPQDGAADDGIPDVFSANPTAPSPTPTVASAQIEPVEEPVNAAIDLDPPPAPDTADGSTMPVDNWEENQAAVEPDMRAACASCLPAAPALPGGRAGAVLVGVGADGVAGLYAVPVGSETQPSGEDSTGLGQINIVPLPTDGLPPLLEDFSALLSPDGRTIVTSMRGLDSASLPETVRQSEVILPGTEQDTGMVEEKVAMAFQMIDANWSPGAGSPLDLVQVIYLPASTRSAKIGQTAISGHSLLFSVEGADGVSRVYQVESTEPDAADGGYQNTFFAIPDGVLLTAELLVENAAAPSLSPNGLLLAFERPDSNGRNLHALALNSGRETAITQSDQNADCYGPQFGPDSLSVFFTCQSGDTHQMLRYGYGGVTTIETGIPNARNPRTGPTGTIYFETDEGVFISSEDGSDPVPYLKFELRNASIVSYQLG